MTAATVAAPDGSIREFGYLPGGVTVIGCCNAGADLDSGSALRQTITVGSTDIKTGSSAASAGTGEFIPMVPLVLTAPTLVKVTTTTAATGHQNGVQYLTFLYYSS